MGSLPTEKGRSPNEDPRHEVTIARRFAVSEFLVGSFPIGMRARRLVAAVNWVTVVSDVDQSRQSTSPGTTPTIYSVAVRDDRTTVPATHRGRMGVRRTGWNRNRLFVGGRDRCKQMRIATGAAAEAGTIEKLRQLDRLSQTASGFMTCMETSLNGSRIATTKTTLVYPSTVRHGRMAIAPAASFAVVRSSMLRRACVRRTAWGTRRMCEYTISSFRIGRTLVAP